MTKRSTILFSALLAAAIIAGCSREQAAGSRSRAVGVSGPPSVGAVMPPYSAELLGGGKFNVEAQKGNVTLLNIWATWCPPCRAEIPDLQKLHDRYSSRGFNVVGVSVDAEGASQEVRDFVREKAMRYPVVLDPEGALADMFETPVIPMSVLVDREGKVVWVHQGTVSHDDPEINQLLEKSLGS
jgi:thiol-disulfide isomerase/thioredoxin